MLTLVLINHVMNICVLCCHTDRGLVSIDGDIIHLAEVVVQEALLRVGLDDLAQGLPAQLLGRQSWGLAVYPLWRPGGGKETDREREVEGESKEHRNKEKRRRKVFSLNKC